MCAVVDEVRVLRLLRSITDAVAMLSAEAAADAVRRADSMWLPGVKYIFITAIEACVDVAQHVCSSQGWGPPSDNGDAIRLLGGHGVLSPGTTIGIRMAVGFRNVLVHEYVDVRDDIVAVRLHDLSDLESFVREVSAYVVHE